MLRTLWMVGITAILALAILLLVVAAAVVFGYLSTPPAHADPYIAQFGTPASPDEGAKALAAVKAAGLANNTVSLGAKIIEGAWQLKLGDKVVGTLSARKTEKGEVYINALSLESSQGASNPWPIDDKIVEACKALYGSHGLWDEPAQTPSADRPGEQTVYRVHRGRDKITIEVIVDAMHRLVRLRVFDAPHTFESNNVARAAPDLSGAARFCFYWPID